MPLRPAGSAAKPAHVPVPVPVPVEAMGPIDRAWLEMDDPKNPMIVSALLEFQGPVRLAPLMKTTAERLLRHPRFRQRVDAQGHAPRWIPDEDMNLDYHVRAVRVPRERTDEEFRQIIAGELGAELDHGLPLWRITFFRRGRRVVAVFRAHHAMADGMAFLKVLLRCADSEQKDAPAPTPSAPAARRRGPLTRWIARMQTLDRALGDLADVVADDLEHPSHLLAQLRDGGRGAAAIARVLSLPEDHPACLRRPLSGRRHVAWTSTLRFAPVRARARALGVTVNDLFVCALAGAFRGYLQGQHESLREGRNLRVSIPVNLRRQDDDALGNFFGLVLLDLPVGIADWRERLAIVAQRMDGLKHSAEPRAVLFALAAAGHMPVPLEKRLVNVVGAKAVAVVSNLPGPRRPLSIGGARLSSLVFWPPQAGGIGIGVSLMSYAGRISVGVSADCALIPEPEAIVAAFEHELQRMLDGSPGRAVKTDPRQRAARSLRQD